MPRAAHKICGVPGCGAVCERSVCARHAGSGQRFAHDPSQVSACKRGYGRRHEKWRKLILHRDPLCKIAHFCEGLAPSRIADHIIPLRAGGDWTMENGQGTCQQCHNWKTRTQDSRFAFGLGKSLIPLFAVCGSPGSGKSTIVREVAGSCDLVLDLDEIKARLSGAPFREADRSWIAPAIAERNLKLSQLGREPLLYRRAWLIATAAARSERAFWREKTGATIIVVNTPIEECLQRIGADASRKNKIAHEELARAWWERYEPDEHDVCVKDAAQLREILTR